MYEHVKNVIPNAYRKHLYETKVKEKHKNEVKARLNFDKTYLQISSLMIFFCIFSAEERSIRKCSWYGG